ncbi:MAG: hypothetical protein R3E32_05745 [Chitinophagales bacterium]
MYQNLDLKLTRELPHIDRQPIVWQSPSNIALVKYWGKYGRQLPRNTSISFTLSQAYTETSVMYGMKKNKGISLDFRFEGEHNEAFAEKIRSYLASITDIFPFLVQLHLSIKSSNSFPHSSGIASSASSMSALALCLCSIEQQLFGTPVSEGEFWQKASYVARLGSGSASRSVFPKLAVWGRHPEINGSADEYALPFAHHLHPNFKEFEDAILIVSSDTKSVSSRAGHTLMEGNPYAATRYKEANQNVLQIVEALKSGDYEKFMQVVEMEALTLHTLMMTSSPSFILMQPNTLTIIRKIQDFRRQSGHPVCFTLDAGPNVHVLYPSSSKKAVEAFIEAELLPHCEDRYWISDRIGSGPTIVAADLLA